MRIHDQRTEFDQLGGLHAFRLFGRKEEIGGVLPVNDDCLPLLQFLGVRPLVEVTLGHFVFLDVKLVRIPILLIRNDDYLLKEVPRSDRRSPRVPASVRAPLDTETRTAACTVVGPPIVLSTVVVVTVLVLVCGQSAEFECANCSLSQEYSLIKSHCAFFHQSPLSSKRRLDSHRCFRQIVATYCSNVTMVYLCE